MVDWKKDKETPEIGVQVKEIMEKMAKEEEEKKKEQESLQPSVADCSDVSDVSLQELIDRCLTDMDSQETILQTPPEREQEAYMYFGISVLVLSSDSSSEIGSGSP